MTAYPPGMEPQQFYAAPKKSVWPTAIGVISIVLGALWMTCTSVGLVVTGASYQSMHQAPAGELPRWLLNFDIARCVVQLLVYILLLIGGIWLVRRRLAAARMLHMIYAVAAFFVVCAGIVSTVGAMNYLANNAGYSNQPSAFRAGSYIGASCVFVLALAYPIFLIAWFARRKIRQEISQWQAAQGQL